MIPFLHLGPLTIPTFGLLVATGLFVAAYVLQADFIRRKIKTDAFLVIGLAGLAGMLGAKFMHLVDTPSDRIPWMTLLDRHWLFSSQSLSWFRLGFAWFGGLIGGFIVLVILAQRDKVPVLEFLDACAPAACVGYAIGRIGCLLSGDGDYGIPTSLPWGMSFPHGMVPTTERVHPTPLYEFLIWLLIALILWKLGNGAIQSGRGTGGKIFFFYLIFTGVARFLIELIRINPRSFYGMSNAQTASVASVLLGLLLLVFVRKPRES